MTHRGFPFLVLGALALSACAPGPTLITSPLQFAPADVGRLVPGERPVAVVVKDERPPGEIVAGGMLGPGGERDEGIYIGYVTEKPAEVTSYMEAAAKEAAGILGFAPGSSGHVVEIALKSFRIDLYRVSGFSPMNCAGYGNLGLTLKGPGGETLKSKELRVAFYENTTPAMSMKEVTREAVSRIYAEAAWEATADLLGSAADLKADPDALGKLMAAMDADKDEIKNRRRAFWLGVLGKDDPRVKEKLLAVFRTSKNPRYREGAVEALGRFGASEAREEILKILSGGTVGDWKTKDAEQTWYLLKALWMMGETDLLAKAPKKEGGTEPRKQVVDEIAFLTTGELPPLTARTAGELEKARKNVKK